MLDGTLEEAQIEYVSSIKKDFKLKSQPKVSSRLPDGFVTDPMRMKPNLQSRLMTAVQKPLSREIESLVAYERTHLDSSGTLYTPRQTPHGKLRFGRLHTSQTNRTLMSRMGPPLDLETPRCQTAAERQHRLDDLDVQQERPKTMHVLQEIKRNQRLDYAIPKLDKFIDASCETTTTPVASYHVEKIHKKSIETVQNFFVDAEAFKGQKFIVNLGSIAKNTVSFEIFQEFIVPFVSPITLEYFLGKVDQLVAEYAVPWAEISFESVLRIVQIPGWHTMPIKEVFARISDAGSILYRAGQRYLGQKGLQAAASKISATWKMYAQRKRYERELELRRYVRWARERMTVQQARLMLREKVNRRWEDCRDFQKMTMNTVRNQWSSTKEDERVIVHIASLSIPMAVRDKYKNIHHWQSMQIGRLADLLQPKTSVVWVMMDPTAEAMQYFQYLLETNFDLKKMADERRLLLVSVEKPKAAMDNVCLTRMLDCYFDQMEDIAAFIQDRNAYLLPAFPSAHELELCKTWHLPMLGSEEWSVKLLHNRVEQRKLALDLGTAVPPGTDDIQIEQDIYTQLQRLLKEYPDVPRWIFKINGEPDGRGIAYVQSKLFEEATDVESIQEILSQNIVFVQFEAWKNWKAFVTSFLHQKGVIEASAFGLEKADNSVLFPAVHFLVEPDGQAKLLGTSGGISLSVYTVWGYMFPQSGAPNDVLVAEACRMCDIMAEQKYVGYLSFEFVYFDDHNAEKQLWCTSIKTHMSEPLSMMYLTCLNCSTPCNLEDGPIRVDCNFRAVNHFDHIAKVKFLDQADLDKSEHEKFSTEKQLEERVAIAVVGLHHKALEFADKSLMHKLWKVYGVQFDQKMKLGTILPVIPGTPQIKIPLITVERTVGAALERLLISMALMYRSMPEVVQPIHNFMVTAPVLVKLLQQLDPVTLRAHRPKSPPEGFELSDFEKYLSYSIHLPFDLLMRIPDGKIATDPLNAMSMQTIALLHAEMESERLKVNGKFEKVSLDKPHTHPYFRNPNRIPTGLKIQEYLNIIEHLIGIESDDDLDSPDVDIVYTRGGFLDVGPQQTAKDEPPLSASSSNDPLVLDVPAPPRRGSLKAKDLKKPEKPKQTDDGAAIGSFGKIVESLEKLDSPGQRRKGKKPQQIKTSKLREPVAELPKLTKRSSKYNVESNDRVHSLTTSRKNSDSTPDSEKMMSRTLSHSRRGSIQPIDSKRESDSSVPDNTRSRRGSMHPVEQIGSDDHELDHLHSRRPSTDSRRPSSGGVPRMPLLRRDSMQQKTSSATNSATQSRRGSDKEIQMSKTLSMTIGKMTKPSSVTGAKLTRQSQEE
ncbi:hypothetical protein EDD86DRAFT_275386 [Gorgonomyces haynaldii]|nr:hypothetical protein EDD86DRAFT_275386 [Gorgonomyces haynaldii]